MSEKSISTERVFRKWRKDPAYRAAYASAENTLPLVKMIAKQKPLNPLTRSLLETAEGMRKSGTMDAATYKKLMVRHFGKKPVG
jgi:hypothetical protein